MSNWIQSHAHTDPEAEARKNDTPQGPSFYDTAQQVSKDLGMPGDCTIYGCAKEDDTKTDDAPTPPTSMRPIESGK